MLTAGIVTAWPGHVVSPWAYSTGMIKVSLTAMPRRLTWFLAKATVLIAQVLTASALAVAGAALAGRLILPGHGFTSAHGYASLTSVTDLRAAVGAVFYLTLIALLSLGLVATVRDSAAAIGLVLGVLYLFPLAADVVSNPALGRHLDQIGPLPAGLDAQGHDQGEGPAADPVARPRRRRPVDRRCPPARRTCPEIARRRTLS